MTSRTSWAAIRTIEEYERAAREAHRAVRHVRVRGAANAPGIGPGIVKVRVRGRWRRRLPANVVRAVHVYIVERHTIGVTLEVSS